MLGQSPTPITPQQIAHSNTLQLAELHGIPSFEIDAVWERVFPFIESALENSYDTPEHCYGLLKKKAAQLWVAAHGSEIQAVCVTQVADNSKSKTCGIWICTGNQREGWQHHIKTIEAWAKSNGCVAMRSEARLGWQRILKPMGYEATHVTLEKVL